MGVRTKMPYNIDSPNLPSYIKNKPLRIRQKWIAIFNHVHENQGEKEAFYVANSWLKRELETLFKHTIESRTEESLYRIPLELQEDRGIIVRSEDGEEYVSFKLADVFKDKFGVQLPINILTKWANKINAGETYVGDVDHETQNALANSAISDDELVYRLKNKQGIAKTVKAIVENGRLWVKAIIDKRYKKLIQNSKGVSMEADVRFNPKTNEVVDADLLGFTFGVKHTPVIAGTEVYA